MNGMCETLKITQQIIRIYLDLTNIKNYHRMIILKTITVPGNMENQRILPSQTKLTLIKEVILTQEKNQQIQ